MTDSACPEGTKLARHDIFILESPPCPPWCTRKHEEQGGWDDFDYLTSVDRETRALCGGSKTCEFQIQSLPTEDGAEISIGLDRYVYFEARGTQVEVHTFPVRVCMIDDRFTLGETEQLISAFEAAASYITDPPSAD